LIDERAVGSGLGSFKRPSPIAPSGFNLAPLEPGVGGRNPEPGVGGHFALPPPICGGGDAGDDSDGDSDGDEEGDVADGCARGVENDIDDSLLCRVVPAGNGRSAAEWTSDASPGTRATSVGTQMLAPPAPNTCNVSSSSA